MPEDGGQGTVGFDYTYDPIESLTLTDLISITKQIYMEPPESLVLSDSMNITAYGFTETLVLTDVILASVQTARTDTLTLSDTVINQPQKVFSEAMTLTDSITRTLQKPSISDTMTLTDAVNVSGRGITGTLTLSDSRVLNVSKVLSDSETLTDSIINAPGKVPQDTITLTDSISYFVGKLVFLTETVTLAESIRKQLNRSLAAETMSLGDFLTTIPGKVEAEITTLSDSMTFVLQRAIQETLNLVDAIIPIDNNECLDVLGLADSIIISQVRTLSENMQLTDSVEKTYPRTLSETLTLSDTVTPLFIFSGVLTEVISLAGTVLFATQTDRNESLGLGDSVTCRLVQSQGKPFILAVDILPVITVVNVAPADIQAIQDRPEIKGVFGNIQTT